MMVAEEGPSMAVTVALIDRIQDAFNRHDVDGILRHFADDVVWLMARGPEAKVGRKLVGKQAIGEVLSARYKQIPDMRWVEMRHWVMGDKAISEWIVQGTLPDGRKLDLLGCDLWEFRGELVTKKDTYWKVVE
jgi:taurine dehydrogenase small subunit